MNTLKIEIDVPIKRVGDLLCTALEGGSNYWYMVVKYDKPRKLEYQIIEGEATPHIDYPLNEGGALWIDNSNMEPEAGDLKIKRLDLRSIKEGLDLWAKKYPFQFHEFMAENEDATTGDSFLQTLVFGEIVYS